MPPRPQKIALRGVGRAQHSIQFLIPAGQEQMLRSAAERVRHRGTVVLGVGRADRALDGYGSADASTASVQQTAHPSHPGAARQASGTIQRTVDQLRPSNARGGK